MAARAGRTPTSLSRPCAVLGACSGPSFLALTLVVRGHGRCDPVPGSPGSPRAAVDPGVARGPRASSGGPTGSLLVGVRVAPSGVGRLAARPSDSSAVSRSASSSCAAGRGASMGGVVAVRRRGRRSSGAARELAGAGGVRRRRADVRDRRRSGRPLRPGLRRRRCRRCREPHRRRAAAGARRPSLAAASAERCWLVQAAASRSRSASAAPIGAASAGREHRSSSARHGSAPTTIGADRALLSSRTYRSTSTRARRSRATDGERVASGACVDPALHVPWRSPSSDG